MSLFAFCYLQNHNVFPQSTFPGTRHESVSWAFGPHSPDWLPAVIFQESTEATSSHITVQGGWSLGQLDAMGDQDPDALRLSDLEGNGEMWEVHLEWDRELGREHHYWDANWLILVRVPCQCDFQVLSWKCLISCWNDRCDDKMSIFMELCDGCKRFFK